MIADVIKNFILATLAITMATTVLMAVASSQKSEKATYCSVD